MVVYKPPIHTQFSKTVTPMAQIERRKAPPYKEVNKNQINLGPLAIQQLLFRQVRSPFSGSAFSRFLFNVSLVTTRKEFS